MIRIELQFTRGSVTLSISEAEALARQLDEKITSAKRQLSGTVELIDNVFIDREVVYDFFRGMLPEKSVPNRAGKMYASIVRSTMPLSARQLTAGRASPLPLQIYCGECDKQIGNTTDECEKMFSQGGHHTYYGARNYRIEAVSLIQHEPHFLAGGSHELSGTRLSDFELFMGALRGA